MTGKTRKVSKGYSSGFVPDYRHVVETIGESEGFGSSNWLDIDMTASTDSSAPKGKDINNRMGYDRFYVPFQVVSLSSMSRSEKKALEARLRGELHQVRILQKRISSVNAVIMSPDSDIHSCTEGLKRPIESIQRPDMNNPLPPRNGTTKKGPGLKRTEAMVQILPPEAINSLLLKQCEDLVGKMLKHKYGFVFAVPVDVVKLKIPDYFTIIKHPMDLGTVRRKLLSGEYSDLSVFGADVRLTFSNAMTYNPPENDVHFMAKTLSKFFEVRWKPIEKKILTSQALAPKSDALVEKETTVSMPFSKKLKTSPLENSIKSDGKVTQETVTRIMSDIEKHKLRTELESSLAELPDRIIDFLKENSSNASQASEDEIEIDLDALSDDTLFKLRKLLDEFQAARLNELKETNEAEVLFESSLTPEKGKEYADACIDISGNGPPTSSSTQVDNEKEVDLKNSQLNSCSSTGDSGSSSDSESESCSKESSDVAKDSAPVGLPKESSIAAGGTATTTITTEEQMKDGVDISDAGADIPLERDGVCLEAEGAPPGRQVSPEKLYRAALLRSRFADTIIRAQEKTQEKGEKLDPEKLQIERELLEKRRKEEKARLQAEAKAVEEARRKAEEEAAAEARRKREIEREAARQALLKMEKTVDINENSQFMEDLQMFRSSVGPSDEHVIHLGGGSFLEEATPDLSGNFSFEASSNPLEQLGLYMKRDDDEEEEAPEPRTATQTVGGPEEGEIDCSSGYLVGMKERKIPQKV